MDAAYDRMFDLLNDDDSVDDNIENDEYNEELAAVEMEIQNLQPPNVDITVRPALLEVEEFDPENNLLDPAVLRRFMGDYFEENSIFTAPISTTNTMEGYLANVRFHEAELIKELIPDEDIVLIRCNFGKLIYDGYTEPVRIKTSNRGRKKKEKKKKLRKIQGLGTDFNSQITFVVRSGTNPPLIDAPDGTKIVPPGSRVYKFKVFRTGKIQLPGVRPDLICDVIDCTKKIVKILNFHLYPGVEDPAKIVRIVNINPVMKNYKFISKLNPGQIIDLGVLKRILLRQKYRFPSGRKQNDITDEEVLEYIATQTDDPPPNGEELEMRRLEMEELETLPPAHPAIFDVKYTREDTKLSIKFSTPIYKKPKKRTRVNIFMRGKINILGAFDAVVTNQIFNYLRWIFTNHIDDEILVDEQIDLNCPEPWVENIEHPESEEELQKIIEDMILALPSLPWMSMDEYDTMMGFIDECYREEMQAIDTALSDFLRGSDLESWM